VPKKPASRGKSSDNVGNQLKVEIKQVASPTSATTKKEVKITSKSPELNLRGEQFELPKTLEAKILDNFEI
jgi:hypothetical protein